MTTPQLRRDAGDPVGVLTPGIVPYATAWDWQRDLAQRRGRDEIGDTILLLEHRPVFTLGKRADASHVVFSEQERTTRGIEVHEIDRGGDVTYHGPGQLVGYPVLRLSGPRVVDYVRLLEEVGIRVAAGYGVDGRRVPGHSGVWVGDAKLLAIGVHVSSQWVTTHGFALNVTTDLTDFSGIIPCGIADKGVCSLASLGVHTDIEDVIRTTRKVFEEVLDAPLLDASAEALALAGTAVEAVT